MDDGRLDCTRSAAVSVRFFEERRCPSCNAFPGPRLQRPFHQALRETPRILRAADRFRAAKLLSPRDLRPSQVVWEVRVWKTPAKTCQFRADQFHWPAPRETDRR